MPTTGTSPQFAFTAVPVRSLVKTILSRLSAATTRSVADLAPTDEGLKLILIRQLVPTSSESPQVYAKRKAPTLRPVSSRLRSGSAVVPVLRSLKLCV